MFGVLQLLAEESPSFAKSSSALTIAPLTDKLGDIKLKKPATDALMTYAEKSSLQFVLSQGEILFLTYILLCISRVARLSWILPVRSLRAYDKAESSESSSRRIELD